MSVMQSEVFEAFRAINVPEDKALKAAEALAKASDRDIAGIKIDVADLKADMRLLKWMVGTHFAVSVAILLKLFIH